MTNNYIGTGVEKNSNLYFCSHTQAGSLFFYAINSGHFFCNKHYNVSRKSFDSILILYVVRGSFSFVTDGVEQTAGSGQIALVNCYNSHTYYSNGNLESYWIHIAGSNICELFEEIKNRSGTVISSDDKTLRIIKEIYSQIKNGKIINESEMSLKIYNLLILLLNSDTVGNDNDIVNKAQNYILLNYQNKITISDIAHNVHLSTSQLSRRFKAKTGVSPYDYLLNIRFAKAKELLKNTDMQISEIAYATGFQSDSNFIYFFKKNEGISPLKFRSIIF